MILWRKLRWHWHVLRQDENDWVKSAWILKRKVKDLETAKENLELQKNIVKPDKYAWKMLWTVEMEKVVVY